MNNLEKLYASKEEFYYSQSRHDMLNYLPPNLSSLLDVGCSDGSFGEIVKKTFGAEVWGIEPDELSAERAKTKLDFLIHDVFTDKLDLGGRLFDCITFNDVLEHLANPWDALQIASQFLNKQGVIVASIPNVQCYSVIKNLIVNQDWVYSKSGILDKTHLRFFTKKSIIRLFEESGYDVIEITGIIPITRGSRLLKLLMFLAKRRIENFTYTNFAIVAKRKYILHD